MTTCNRVESPIVSVVVPVYNVKNYLQKCIDSLLCQSFKNLEIILVDDGSVDGSGDICDTYEKMDSRIRVLHKSNGGVSSARNLGLDNVRGLWVTFVDSDDFVGDTYVESLYRPILEGDNVDFVHAGILNWKNGVVGENQRYDNLVSDDVEVLFDNFRGLPASKLYKTEIIEGWQDGKPLRFDERMRIAEDMAFTLDYVISVRRFAFVSDAEYYYRQDNLASATKRKPTFDYECAYHSAMHIYKSQKNFVLRHNLSVAASRFRYQQSASNFLEAMLVLYRVGFHFSKRVAYLKCDYVENEEVMDVLSYAKVSVFRKFLCSVIRRKHYIFFDFLVNFLFKVKRFYEK